MICEGSCVTKSFQNVNLPRYVGGTPHIYRDASQYAGLGTGIQYVLFPRISITPFIILRGARTARVILFFSNRVYFIKDVNRTPVGRRHHQGTLVLWRTHPPYKVFSSLLITHRGTIATTFYRDTNLLSVSDAQGSAFS